MFVVNSEKTRKLLKELVGNFGTVKNTSKFLKTSENNLRRFIRGERPVPFEIIMTISKYKKFDVFNFLDGERIKSGPNKSTFRIVYDISDHECMLIGWILTDGHLGEGNPVSISQKSKETLEKLKNIIEPTFDFKNTSIYPDRANWKLVVSSTAFREYLKLRYNLPSGKKSDIIEVPKNIFNTSLENKWAFISGCAEGDGSFTTFIRKTLKGYSRLPRIVISSNSKNFLEGIEKLLNEWEIKPTINLDGTKFKLSISRLKDCVKFFFGAYPYMVDTSKINNFINSFSDTRILNVLTIKNTRNLINDWKRVSGNSWGRLKEVLESKLKYNVSLKTTRLLGLPSNTPPLSVVIEACEALSRDAFDYIPKWYSGVLWLYKLVPRSKFEEFRGLKIKEPKTYNVLKETFGTLKGWTKPTQEIMDEIDKDLYDE